MVVASATETPRLLLNSKSKKFPDGVGNNNDWVGRNLQGHAYSGAFGDGSGLLDWGASGQEIYLGSGSSRPKISSRR